MQDNNGTSKYFPSIQILKEAERGTTIHLSSVDNALINDRVIRNIVRRWKKNVETTKLERKTACTLSVHCLHNCVRMDGIIVLMCKCMQDSTLEIPIRSCLRLILPQVGNRLLNYRRERRILSIFIRT